jgi:hypothetical protein
MEVKPKRNFKNQILNAGKEVLLIVVGILLAMYIDNWNATMQKKKSLDSNFQRVYSELEKNINEAKDNIEGLYHKDSLIYLVMNDSIKPKDYTSNFGLAYLILFYHNLSLDDKAYQNLIRYDVLDDNYREDLIVQLKDLNALNEEIKNNNDRMSAFVYEEALPLVAKNTKTFGDLTYKGIINKDVVDYYTTSSEYKSYVSQYAIIALKNQLKYYQIYLRLALKVYGDIGKIYNFKANKKMGLDSSVSKFEGRFYNERYRDTIQVSTKNDSLFFVQKNKQRTNLISFGKNHFILDNKEGKFFIAFLPDEKNKSNLVMHISYLTNQIKYIRLDTHK